MVGLHLQDSKETKMTEESEMSTEVTIYLQEDKGVGNVLWEIESQEILGQKRNSNFPCTLGFPRVPMMHLASSGSA